MKNPDKMFIAVVDLDFPNVISHLSLPSEVFNEIPDVEEWLKTKGFLTSYCQWWVLGEHNPNLEIDFREYND